MSTYSQVDTSTLGWVKAEIDETLKQARLSLETFVDDTSDDSRLRYCITHLHQVVGTLLMVELDGAANLAKETEALADSVYKGETEPSEAVFEALTRGILSIPDHLARLQFGQADSPLRLLPLINDLRTAHGVKPISELDLFTPDLSVRPPENKDAEKLRDPAFVELAKKLRHPFQQALLSWLRNGEDQGSLEKMAQVIDELRDKARIASIEQLFWAAGAMIEAFHDNGLDATNERKRLISRLDQNMKKLIDGADKSALRAASEDLLKSMLLEIGYATSRGVRVSQLKQAFALDALVPQEMDSDADIEDLPTPEALKSVADALGQEIIDAQEILSGFFDEEMDEVESLEPVLPLFHKMSNTLDMLGIKPLKELTDELSETSKAVIDGSITDIEVASMPMARALLIIEQSTKEMHGSPVVWKQQVDDAIWVLKSLYSDDIEAPTTDGLEVSDDALSDIEFKQLAAVVGEEVRVNLNKIEEILETFAANPAKVEVLKEVPQNLIQIQGALQILGQDRASEFTLHTSDYVDQVVDGRLPPTPAVLDGLAVSIGTIGAYVEGLQFNRASLDLLIDAAEQDMERAIAGGGEVVAMTAKPARSLKELAIDFEKSVNQWTSDTSNESTRSSVDDGLRDIISVAGRLQNDVVSQIGEQMNTLLEIVDDDPSQINDDLIATLRQSAAKLVDLADQEIETAPVVVAPAPTPSSAAVPAPFSDDIDEEIMEIFIEDAQDCIQSINREFPRWREKPDDKERLKELRRNYHTLKGSGRMVGASDISELAWAIENMLNKVRDNKISYSDKLFALLEQVAAVLPEMVVHLQGGPAAAINFEALRLLADDFAAGNQPDVPVGSTISAPATGTVAPAPAPAAFEPFTDTPSVAVGILPQLDETLLQIFTVEARGHLATLEEEISACRAAGGCSVSANLIRATHTLRGSGRSVGLQFMSDACGNMEKLLQELETLQQTLNETHLHFLQGIHLNVSQLVSALSDSGIDPTPVRNNLLTLATEIQRELDVIEGQAGPESGGVAESFAPVVPPVHIPPVVPAAAVPAQARHEADHVDPELLEIFQEEAVDLLQAIEDSLTRWRTDKDDRDAVSDLKRALHTLKGGARMAGAMTMGGVSHDTESLLEQVENGSIKVDSDLLDLLDEVHDTVAAMLDQLQSGQSVGDASELQARINALIAGDTATAAAMVDTPVPMSGAEAGTSFAPIAPVVPVTPAAPAAPVVDRRTGDRGAEDRRHVEDERRDASRTSGDRRGQNQIRVRTELLNELVNYAGEVSISRSRMEQQIFGFRENLQELHGNVTRFREQLRDLEIQSESQILFRTEREAAATDSDFDPLEFDRFTQLQQLSRGLTESLHDLSTIQSSLDTHIGEAETVLQQQARLNTDLQEGLMRTRMVDFSTQAARLRHIVRQTSRELGKRVELNLGGATNVEIDRNVLERMIGPFEHMIRNSVDHGVEDAATRAAAGKSATGTITISTAQEGSEIVIRFADDGAGLDVNAIRSKAIERGLMPEDSTLSEEEIIQFILVSGFSTAKTVTHLSGRGVGMDVVHNEVKQLGGTMSVDTQTGAGTTFVVRLPLTLSITQALMIGLGEQLFAIPISTVSNILEVPVETLDQIKMGEKPLLHHGDTIYPFAHLAKRLELVPRPRNENKVPVLLVKTGSREVAMQVDMLVGTREIVIKALGKQLNELTGIAGATILGDGQVVLILDVPALMITEEALHVSRGAPSQPRPSTSTTSGAVAAPAAGPRRPTIMVVDDSLTVRKVTSRGMKKHGMEVTVAKDGVDALEQLRGDQLPDVMLVDIEMPRMDGYELTSRIREDDRLKHIPIIMITSRAGEKHRKRAFELGVNDYMSKPYQEDKLVEAIGSLLPAGVSL
jgi:chemosensory pili system protein ChpA (sensor histidine kinase/response regulator)